ncbi:hypothetical protein LTR37_009910 [Vermiconidia calcicola]|uniref:Uncharacterized protein n=1 Tax=Vermiconidia calcicola TaxID=1690605 RepID=A0ACC3N6F9_9PEZI|nr:hypothetical protein LTR37_009910 [Vermiconidia calcicola]
MEAAEGADDWFYAADGLLRNGGAFLGAGAEVCVRERRSGGGDGDGTRWMTYRPLSAAEGRDDVMSLHLLRPQEGEQEGKKGVELITGTANGDLQLLNLSGDAGDDSAKTYFTTQGLPVRSTSLHQESWKPPLLAANLGDTRICLYSVDSTQEKIAPTSQIDVRPPANANGGHQRTYRTWSTNFLSSTHLAVGLGPSTEPIHIYTLTSSGLDKTAVRKYSLQDNDLSTKLEESAITNGTAKKPLTSSIYPIIPLPPSSTFASGSSDGQVFLTGAYDGVIRLHDLRSNREVEKIYTNSTDDSAIYSLLPRGQETLIAGTSRHSLLKIFDLRLGAKAYSYLDATATTQQAHSAGNDWNRNDWNLFLKPHTATYPGRGGGNNWARRSAESSVYSLASPAPHSPYLYCGVENAVVEMAFTSVLDPRPDPAFAVFGGRRPGEPSRQRQHNSSRRGSFGGEFQTKEILDLAHYNPHDANMKLMTQRSVWETLRLRQGGAGDVVMRERAVYLEGLDERWRVNT